jgi:hypothetical protein
MNRQNLINRLVARKLQPSGGPKANGDGCYAAKQRHLCWCIINVKSLCYATGTKN